MIQFYDDTVAAQSQIEATILKFGYAPEHNYFWYQYNKPSDEKNIFVLDDTGAGLLTMMSDDDATVFSSRIAPPERRASILVQYIKEIFQMSDMKKVHFELETPLRKEFLKLLPAHCEAKRINYSLVWPVMNLKTFDSTLSGKHYKSLRKERNRFYRDHAIAVQDAKALQENLVLRNIIEAWEKNRPYHTGDPAWCEQYINLIENRFVGMETARMFSLDGRCVGINAGWMIPNSERFYGAIGIHDYSVPSLGKMLYLEDLEYLKNHGYAEVDMGGSWQGGLTFKNEFLPESYYKTHIFSVAKK